MIKVELIATPGCSKCGTKKDKLRAAAEALAKGQIVWREVDVLDEIDYVVGLGVLTLPAVAINGKLVFRSLPSISAIKREIRKHLPGAAA